MDLESEAVVAFEVLARGPEGLLATPDALFSAARRTGMLREIDELCHASAFLGASAVGPVAPLTLFVNVEPEVLSSASIEELLALAESVAGQLRVVMEFTERALTSRPAELLRTADRVRELGWGVALDDVGAARPRWRSWRSCAHSVCSNPQPSRRRQTGVALRVPAGAHVVAEVSQAAPEDPMLGSGTSSSSTRTSAPRCFPTTSAMTALSRSACSSTP